MEAKDLRIGNYVKYEGYECYREINEISKHCIKYHDSMLMPYCEAPDKPVIVGIPLTEEWLVKFGFWYDGNQQEARYNISMMGYDCVLIEGKRAFEFWVDDEYCLVDIKYVHELQNLYKVLTGHDLTIK
jgi:hypothetical protein